MAGQGRKRITTRLEDGTTTERQGQAGGYGFRARRCAAPRNDQLTSSPRPCPSPRRATRRCVPPDARTLFEAILLAGRYERIELGSGEQWLDEIYRDEIRAFAAWDPCRARRSRPLTS